MISKELINIKNRPVYEKLKISYIFSKIQGLEGTRTNSKLFPNGIYLFKVNNRNTIRTRCEICSTLTIKTPE